MSFHTLRNELHHCCNLDEIIAFLLEHAGELCAAYDCAPPIALSYTQFMDQGPVWTFQLWTCGDGVFCEDFVHRVLVALGFWVQWTAVASDPKFGCDSFITMIQHEWPIMQVSERLAA